MIQQLTSILFFLLVVSAGALSAQDEIHPDSIPPEDIFIRELGFEWGIGPSISHFTNVENPDQSNVVGVTAFAGIDWLLHPVVSIYSHLKLTQYGNGTNFENGYNRLKFLNLGVDIGTRVRISPDRKVYAFLLAGMDFGLNVSTVTKTKQNGDKDKVRSQLNDLTNRAFAGVTGGAGVTLRTNVVDFTLQAEVTGGLTLVDKNAPENAVRSVPFFAEIPIIIRYFGRSEQKRRPNLLILVEPDIVDPEDLP